MKICPRCGIEKDDSAFDKCRTNGLKSHCKACRSAAAKAYNSRPEIKARHSERGRRYVAEHQEETAKRLAEWHMKNKARRNEDAKNNRRRLLEESPAAGMVERARRRAKELGVPFNLRHEDIVIPDVCPVLGIPLYVRKGKCGPCGNSPSLDRFDPKGGYTMDNVVIISHRANTLKNNATLEEMARVLAYMKAKPMTLERAKADRALTASATNESAAE